MHERLFTFTVEAVTRQMFHKKNNVMVSIILFSAVRCSEDGTGVIFLAEVALGKEHLITRPDGTLTSPPTGYDSVIGKGVTEPGEQRNSWQELATGY